MNFCVIQMVKGKRNETESGCNSILPPSTYEFEYVDCPICGPSETEIFAIQDNFRIVKCQGCGLVYVNPRLKTENLSKFFSEDYINNKERAEVVFISSREHSLAREAKRIKKLFPQGGRLLDIGSGPGIFLKKFKGDSQWHVEGVEVSYFAAKYARETFGLNVHTGFLADQKFSDASFDIVTCLDTFYLIPKPNDELSEISRIIKPGGILAIEIPGFNFRRLKNTGFLCRLIYGTPVHLNPAYHLFFYSRKTLTHLVSHHGFEYVNTYLEQSPIRGSKLLQALNSIYFFSSSLLYYMSFGKFHLTPKDFIIFRKAIK